MSYQVKQTVTVVSPNIYPFEIIKVHFLKITQSSLIGESNQTDQIHSWLVSISSSAVILSTFFLFIHF